MNVAKAPFLLLLLIYAGVSQATLGGSPEPFDAESTTVVSGTTPAGSHYVTRETTLATGTIVREYVADNGVVFALTWEGPFLPDLKALLGKYFDTLVAESAKMPRAGRSHLSVSDPEVVIHSSGHMRAFEGSAWIPTLFPVGFSDNDLR